MEQGSSPAKTREHTEESLEEGGSVEERQNDGDGGMEVKTWRTPSGILQEVQRSRECFERTGSKRVHIGTLVLLGCNREVEVERGPLPKKTALLQTP